jgi:hypothetical protein
MRRAASVIDAVEGNVAGASVIALRIVCCVMRVLLRR